MIAPRNVVLRTTPYPAAVESRASKLRLDLNESRWGCSPKVVETLRQLDADHVSVYPEYRTLVSKLSQRLGVDAQNILVTNGSDDAIRCVTDAYLEKGSQVVIPVPTFTVYAQYCGLREAAIVEVPCNEDLSYPVEGVLEAIGENTKMVVLVNPNNPTGTSISREDLTRILETARDAIVVLDEAYWHYAGQTHVELCARYPNLVVLHTFSKAYGLAGLRIGCIISAETNVGHLARINPPYAVNAAAVMAACATLDDQAWLDRVVSEARTQRESLRDEIGGLGLDTHETETNFLVARTGRWTDLVLQGLREKGILVKDLRDYPLLDGCLRITVGRREENETLVEALRGILPVEAVLFDMDGVLVDVSSSYRLAIKQTAEFFLGREVSLSEIQEYKRAGGYGNDWDLTAALVASGGMQVGREEIIDVFQGYYLGEDFDGLVSNERWLLDQETLRTLGESCLLGIVTGRPHAEAEYVLGRFQVRDFFDVVVTMDDVPEGRGKPDPYGVQLAMKKLRVKRAVYAGDTVDDLQAAIAAPAIPVGVVSRSGDPGDECRHLREHGASLVLEDVNEIVEVLR